MAPSVNYHTPDEWEAIRPIFTRLYIVDGRKLNDVQAILAQYYDFTTTCVAQLDCIEGRMLTPCSVKQCKTRITQWKLAKYNKVWSVLAYPSRTDALDRNEISCMCFVELTKPELEIDT